MKLQIARCWTAAWYCKNTMLSRYWLDWQTNNFFESLDQGPQLFTCKFRLRFARTNSYLYHLNISVNIMLSMQINSFKLTKNSREIWIQSLDLARIWLFKVNSRKTKTICETSSNSAIKTPEWLRRHRSCAFIVNFEQISHTVLVFTLLILNK